MKKYFAFALLALAFCGFAFTLQASTPPVGFKEMVENISGTKPEELAGKTYKLTVDGDGQWDISLSPAPAFVVERLDRNSFQVTIVAADLLFEELGGIQDPVDISYEIRRGGSDRASLELAGSSDCIYNISFSQKNGNPVNFEEAQQFFDIEFIYDENLIRHVRTGTETATFERLMNGKAFVILRLTREDRVIESTPVMIPFCNELATKTSEILMLRKPGHCIINSKSQHTWTKGNDVTMVDGFEEYANTSDRAVRCSLTYRYQYFEDKDRTKMVHEETDTFDFVVPAFGSYRIEFSHSFDEVPRDKAAYFRFRYPETTDDNMQLIGRSEADFVCVWND